MSLSALQKATLARVAVAHSTGSWYRAQDSGERVTLASLYRKALLRRRARRGKEGEADAAYEYRVEAVLVEVMREIPGMTASLAEKIAAVNREGETP